jgi:hypothetical protein
MIPRTFLPIRTLKLDQRHLLQRMGRLSRYSVPNWAPVVSRAGVKQLPLLVSKCMNRKEPIAILIDLGLGPIKRTTAGHIPQF